MPRISVVIPVYNRPVMLTEAVDSVLRQTYDDYEIIIVDDGSTDETADVAKRLVERWRPKITYLRQENAGPGVARNTGIAVARGEFLQFLDSDDLLAPEKFAWQLALLDANPDRGVCYCTTLRGPTLESSQPSARSDQSFDWILPDFLLERGWSTLSPIWRRSACDVVGPFSARRIMEDWEFDCRAGLAGIRPIHCPMVLAYVRDHGGARAGLGMDNLDDQRVIDYFSAHRTVTLGILKGDLVDQDARSRFARKLFFVSRFCAERGLISEAQEASDLALRLMPPGAWAFDQRIVRSLARCFGWPSAVRIAKRLRMRNG